MKHIFLSSLALCVALMAMAASEETVRLKNGSVYMGHTMVKNFPKQSADFMVDSAFIVLKNDEVKITESEKDLNLVSSRKWQDWFKAHPEYVSVDAKGNKRVRMYNVTPRVAGAGRYSNVVLLERGEDTSKILSMDVPIITIMNDDAVAFEYATRDPKAISGIVDEILTTDGIEHVGKIVRETPDGIAIFTNARVTEVVSYDKVKAIRKRALYDNQPIDCQTKYLEELITTDGRYLGVITAINFQPGNDKAPYYSLRIADGDVREFPFDDVTVIQLEPNKKYEPITDIVIESADSIYANGCNLLPSAYSYNSKHSVNDFNEDHVINEIKVKDGSLKIQARNSSENGNFYLIPLNRVRYDKRIYRSFSDSDLVNNAIMPEKSISPYGNVTYDFPVSQQQLYVLYRPSGKQAFVIRAN